MKKLSFTLASIFLYQFAPLLAAPDLLLHWKIIAIAATAAILWLSQPALRQHDLAAHRKADRHTVLLILVMAGVSTVVPELEWAYFLVDQTGSLSWNMLGLTLMSAGTGYRIWAIRSLGRHFTAMVQTGDEQRLITDGPYRRLRHPSYLGAFAAIVGCAVLLQAWVGVGVAVVAMLFAYHERITAEEEALYAHFKDDYRSYQARTWRMLPGIW